MQIRIVYIFLFLGFFSSLSAQEVSLAKDSIEVMVMELDTSIVEKKSFSTERLNDYKFQEEFNYEIKKSEPSFLLKTWRWIKDRLRDFLRLFIDDIEPTVGVIFFVLKAIPWILLVILILVIANYFTKIKAPSGSSLIAKNLVDFSDDEVLKSKEDLEEILKDSLQKKDYKQAVRYYYLLVLQHFIEKKVIDWNQDKTNEDFIKQLKNTAYSDGFIQITRIYDFVWYGDFEIDEKQFVKAEEVFKKLLKS